MSEYQDLYEKILSLISADDLFSGFKYRKRDCNLILTEKGYRKNVYLSHWKDDFKGELVIYPVFGVTFNELLSWFKTYSLISIQDQKDNYSFGFASCMLGCPSSTYHFKINGDNFQESFNVFKRELIDCANWVFKNYGTLDLAYQNEIIPLLNETKEMPNGGIEWALIDLTLCKIVAPHNYETFKEMVLKRIEFLHERNEPNVADYYSKLDEIISFMESKSWDELKAFKL